MVLVVCGGGTLVFLLLGVRRCLCSSPHMPWGSTSCLERSPPIAGPPRRSVFFCSLQLRPGSALHGRTHGGI